MSGEKIPDVILGQGVSVPGAKINGDLGKGVLRLEGVGESSEVCVGSTSQCRHKETVRSVRMCRLCVLCALKCAQAY